MQGNRAMQALDMPRADCRNWPSPAITARIRLRLKRRTSSPGSPRRSNDSHASFSHQPAMERRSTRDCYKWCADRLFLTIAMISSHKEGEPRPPSTLPQPREDAIQAAPHRPCYGLSF